MNTFKQNLFTCLIFLNSVHVCHPGVLGGVAENAGINTGLNTVKFIKESIIEFGAWGKEAVVKAAEYGKDLALDHPSIAKGVAYMAGAAACTTGAIIVVAPVAGAGLLGYCWYTHYRDKKAALALQQSDMRIGEENARVARETIARKTLMAEENARVAREIMARETLIAEENARVDREVKDREIRIREEDVKSARETLEKNAKIALGIMQRNAKIRNIIIIATVATIAGFGIGYIGHRIYKNRQKEKEERDLSGPKQTLLDAIVSNAQHEVGVFGLPEGCGQAAGALLALPGGQKSLDEIVRASQQPIANAVTL